MGRATLWRGGVVVTISACIAIAGTAFPCAGAASRTTIVAERKSLSKVFLELGTAFGVSVVLLQNFDYPVTATLTDVSLPEALAALAGARGIRYVRSGRLILIGDRPASASPPSPEYDSDAIALTNVRARDALPVLRAALPKLEASAGPVPSLLIVRGAPGDVASAHRLVAALDVPDPNRRVTQAIVLQHAPARAVAAELQRAFGTAHFYAGANGTIVAEGALQTLDRAKELAAALDVAPPVTTSSPGKTVAALSVTQGSASDVARTVAQELPGVKASVSAGGQVVVAGPSAEVARAQAIVAQVDRPLSSDRYVQLYRLHSVDARSVGDLIARTFRDATVTPDVDLNSLAITATAREHGRIADAIAQLDTSASVPVPAGSGPPVSQAGSDLAAGGAEVVTLKAAVPGLSGAEPTSATDIATAVGQALQQSAPDLRITVPANATQLILGGSPNSIRQAKELIDKLDTLQKLVVLDTEIYEVDETTAKTLGLRFITPLLSTTYTETTPAAPASGGNAPPLLGLQQLSRTPLSLGAQLDLSVATGKARIIADPRLTTISGRTASLRAGENLAIQTQVGGGTGTVATTQIQTFQTGVTLDITPVINAGDYISVTLHPTVNSNTGFVAGIPQISTRDTQTTVAMREGQTLFIGGLIEETTTRDEQKIPLLGDLPLIGPIFRDTTLSYERNELVITVTPHIIDPEAPKPLPPPPSLGNGVVPAPFPTIPPGILLPTERPLARSRRGIAAPASAPLAVPASPATPLPATPLPATPQPGAQPPGTPSNVSLPPAAAAPGATAGGAAPPDTFVYGQKPAAPLSSSTTDPPQIAYVLLTPTSFRSSATLHLEAITSTNVSRMTIGYNGFLAPINPTTPGAWQSNFAFVNSGLGQLPQNISLTLTAYRQDGAQTAIAIPVTITP
jgi:type II secretory pathway component GspD/PulD (secretin)